MTRICAVSDLHVDMGSQAPIQWPDADVLVVAGDTANSIGEVEKFFRKLKKDYPDILFVDGNHEHYSNANQERSLDDTLERLHDLLPVTMLPLVHHKKVDDLYFVGRNGWYSMDAAGDPDANKARWRDVMNDDHWIGFTKLGHTKPWDLAVTDAMAIDNRIETIVKNDPEAKIVVVTHTAPTRDTLSQLPQHLLDNCFYANLHMEAVIEKYAANIALWIHGHTHYRQEKIVHGVPVLVNPRGYPRENPNWEPVIYDI